MNPKELSLNFNKADFEEIHFRNTGKLLFSKNIKPHFIATIVVVCLLAISVIIAITQHKGWGIVVITAVVAILISYELIKKISPVLQWKKSIKESLNNQAKFINQKISLSENTLTFKQDTKITMVRWTDFKRAVIDDKSITLFGDETLLFPKKSMSYQDFDLLREQVLLQMKS